MRSDDGQRNENRKKLITLLLVSLLIHTVVALFVGKFSEWKLPVKKEKQLRVQLNPPKSKDKKMQVVQQNKKTTQEPENKDADFWSIQNQKAKKQTKAPRVDDFKQKTTPPQLSQPTPPSQPSQKSEPKKKVLSKHKGRIPISQSEKIVKNLFNSLNKELVNRTPAVEESSATDDYLKKIEVGQQTMLNTREFKFYSYFERVRSQLKQYWRPLIQQKFMETAFAQRRDPAGRGEKITRVHVRLDNVGRITKILVLKSSGVGLIDTAAVEAFQKAGPFPNPPKGMIEKDGTVNLQWEFVLIVNT